MDEDEDFNISHYDSSIHTPMSKTSRVISSLWQRALRIIWSDPCAELNTDFVDDLASFDDHLLTVNTTHYEYYYSLRQPTNIVKQDMDGVFEKFLLSTHLIQYQWFFNALDYQQIISIDERSINNLIAAVNRTNKNGHSIKRGCKMRICYYTKAMKQRSIKIPAILEFLQNQNPAQDINPNVLLKVISYMQDILKYPLPNKHCVRGVRLQNDIILVLQYFARSFCPMINCITHLHFTITHGKILMKYFECTKLIRENPLFNYDNIDRVMNLQKTVIDQMERVFAQTHFQGWAC